jgi:protein O-mannosyl-transferase
MNPHPPPANANAGRPAPGWSWPGALILLVFTLMAYWPAWNAGFIWDDDAYVTDNPALRSLDGLQAIWLKPMVSPQYYPLVFTSFWLEYHLWGLHPAGYHLVNVLLHAANAMLLWLVLRRLKVPGAWWAAAIFALHPVMTESVAWVTERKNVLSGLFYLLAALAFLRFRPPDGTARAAKSGWRFYPVLLALFLCALLCKTVTCSLPAALLLVRWWQSGRVEKRDLASLAPLFVLGAALGLATVWLEKHHVGATGADWTLSFGQRCLLAGRALWFYAGKLVWPAQMTFIYPRWQIDGGVGWQYLFPIAALAVLICLWRLRQKIGRGALAAVLFFASTLAPALGFVDVYPFRFSFVADHFQYLAGIGLITLIAATGAALCARSGPGGRYAGIGVGCVVLLALGIATWQQAGIYKNAETLWLDTLQKNPGCWLAHNNLGVLRTRQGRTGEAIRHGEQAIQLKADYPEAYYNLGNAYLQSGNPDPAGAQFRQAIRLQPDFAQAHNNLGNVLLRQGKIVEAREHYEQAVRWMPDYADAHNNLANLLLQEGKLDEAIVHYQKAIQINPDYVDAHYNLGMVFGLKGQLDRVAEQYQIVVKLKPDHAEAQGNLANVLAARGKLDEAIEAYRRTLALIPNSAQAHFRFGQALQARRRFPEAIAEYRKALDLAPRHQPARLSLAWVLATGPEASLRDGRRAVELAKEAEQLSDGKHPEVLDTLAAAYAEAGRFPEAIETARRASALSAAQNNQPLTEAIQSRLQLYAAHSPYHEKP